MCLDNLRRVAEKCLPSDRIAALNSYFKYKELTSKIADNYGFTPETGAAVFAALSPNNDYFGNLRDCDRLLRAAVCGLALSQFSVSTYGNNKIKAWRIAKGENPLDLIVANKTRNFFLNITDPTDPVPVTVDGHMLNCWRNEKMRLVGLRSTKNDYHTVADGVRQVASELNLIPSQCQGLIWLTWKRIHSIRLGKQQEFWDPEFIAARIGFFPDSSRKISF